MKIPLEDNFTDILAKAQRGLKISDEDLARRAGVSVADLVAAKSGNVNEPSLRRLAPVLGLGPAALVTSAKNTWYPSDPGRIEGLACFNTPYGDMTVNSYLVFDPPTNTAAAFDTGADCGDLLDFVNQHRLKVELVLITHIHGDHILALDLLKEKTGGTAWVSDRELLAGTRPFPDGREFQIGRLRVQTRRTSGHARGGVTYVVDGLSRRLAITGDAMFAGSMGGGMVDYQEALRTNRESILSLPDDTLLCPGHGPLATVGEQKQHNPFFAP